jgi:hypothetical protein
VAGIDLEQRVGRRRCGLCILRNQSCHAGMEVGHSGKNMRHVSDGEDSVSLLSGWGRR